MTEMNKSLRVIFLSAAYLLFCATMHGAKGDLAPFNFIPDPGFENWTPGNPIFNSDVDHSNQINLYGSYNIVSELIEKNVNYLNCDYGEKIFVADGIPYSQNDPTTRFLLLEYVIDVNPGRDYELLFRYMNPDVAWPGQPPIISVELDGIEILEPTPVVNLDSVCDPNLFAYTFDSGNRNQITLSIYNNAIYRYPDTEGINAFSIRGNDIALWGFEMYQYCEMTDNSIEDFSVCEGETIPLIEKILTDVDGDAQIDWRFESGATFSGPQVQDYQPTQNERVFVEILSDIGCTEFDTFDIRVFQFPENIEIGSNLAEPRLCPCETTSLEIPDNLPVGNFNYLWTSSDPNINIADPTETVIIVDTPGEYSLLITEENLNCTRELNFVIEGIGGSADIYVETTQGEIGEETEVVIGSNISQEFIDCGIGEIEAKLLYDYTVLHNPNIIYTVESEGIASYPVTIPVNTTISIPYSVLLGLSEQSALELFDYKLICNDYDEFFEVNNGTFTATGICKEPGSRLIQPSAAFEIRNSYIVGNKLLMDLNIQESTTHYIRIFDISGRVVSAMEFEGNMGELKHLELDLQNYSKQSLFFNIQTLVESSTYMIGI